MATSPLPGRGRAASRRSPPIDPRQGKDSIMWRTATSAFSALPRACTSSPALGLILALALPAAAPAPGHAGYIDGDYDKTFYTTMLPNTAQIFAGAFIETWAGDRLLKGTVTYKGAVGT